jgi:flagellar hook-associated protein FlgK
MGIYNITETAFAGLQIAQAGMLVTSQNVTGSSIAGFNKRTANTVLDGLAPNSLILNGTSFAVDGFTRSYSTLVGSQLLAQQAVTSYSDTLVQYTQSIDSLVSDQNTGLTSALTTFFNAMGTYAADPTSKTSAAAITASANNVASRINGVATIADTLLSNSKSGLTDTIRQVNTLLPELASINAQITASRSPGNTTPSADLLDERDRILSSLQKLVGGQSLINGDGTATQLVNSIPLVERTVANTMTISPDQTAIGVKFNSKDTLSNPNGQVLQTIDSGQAGALLSVINNFVPSIEQRLNSIAIGLVQVANSAGQSGGPGSATNVPIFGFKVGNSVFASLKSGSSDPTGSLPNINSDEDLTNFYNSLKNVVSSPLLADGAIVGSFSKVSSIFSDISKAAPNGYTLTQVYQDSNGTTPPGPGLPTYPTNQITLTPNPVNGIQGPPQTVSIANGVLGASQSINFSQYGISINLNNPAKYVNNGVAGLYAGQKIGNQNITSVFASGNLQRGAYTIIAGTGQNLGKVALNGPGINAPTYVSLQKGQAGGQRIEFGSSPDILRIELSDNGSMDDASTIASQLDNSLFSVGLHDGAILSNNGEYVDSISSAVSAQPGTYQLSASGGSLTLSANINGTPISQTVAISPLDPGATQTISFNDLGISFAIKNPAGANSVSSIALASELVGTSPQNQITIAAGVDTGLDLASGLDTKTFSVTGQTNSALVYGLTAENFVSLAPSDPIGYMNGTTPYITSAAANSVSSMHAVFGNAVANLVSDVGTKVATWKNNQKADTAVLNNLQSQSNSISGVNLDEEAANLLKYQQLYSASSKVLQVGNQMFTTLLGIMN